MAQLPIADAEPPRLRRGPAFWLRAARAPFFTGSLAPILVGASLAFSESGHINWLHALLALLALTCLHAAANLANDYYDHVSGNDEANVSFATPFTGGSRFIQQGLARPREILAASLISIAAGGLMGAYLVWATGWPVLALGAVGAVTGFCYSAPPLKLGYRGLGELFIMLDFGVLPVLGAYYVQAQAFTLPALIASLPVGFLMTNVLWINQFQDSEADAAVGKRNWVVRLGRRRAAAVHLALFALAVLSIAVGIAAHLLPAWSALAFLSLPLAAKASLTSAWRYDDLPHLVPANVATIATHLATSLLLSAGLALSRW
ncbi:MAG: 1,4-dihydroxy-2-naphthoate octaprenyltransferase [Armatimonadota bacterium]